VTRADLLALVRSLRAHVEGLAAAGAWGVPSSPAAAGASHSSEARAPQSALALPGTTRRESPASTPGVRPASGPPPRERPAAPSARRTAEPGSESAPPAAPEASPIVHLPPAALARLQVLASEARSCTKCGLCAGRTQSVFARGTGSSGLAFVGEGPGEEEDRQGQPFVGAAGQLLDRMIAAMQLGRDEVYVCNIVKCRPPNNRKPEPEEMARCMPFLSEQLELIAPRVIVALGATAVQGLLGTTEGITRLRGQWKLYRGKIPVMPTFHPAYLLRTPSAKRDVWRDLQEVLRQLNGSAPAP
jgi:uracil-DNA glycosylase